MVRLRHADRNEAHKRRIDILIKTTEIFHSAIQAQDGDKAVGAVNILIMQVFEFFGYVEGTFEILFPFLEELKEKIEAEDFTAAKGDVFTLLTKFRAIGRPSGRQKKPTVRLDS